MPPINGAHGVPPIHRAHSMQPIHIHGSRLTHLHYLLHIILILVPTAQHIPLLVMSTVGTPMVCRPLMPMMCRSPVYIIYLYTTYPSADYTIYTIIGYGHWRPTHGLSPIHGADGVPPIYHSHYM
jgi:hypothetical protein